MNIPSYFLCFKTQAQIFRWQSLNYQEFEVFDEFCSEFDSLIDLFLGAFRGKYGRIIIDPKFIEIMDRPEEDNSIIFMNDLANFLMMNVPVMLNKDKDSDLFNIRDQMLALINKTKFLLSMAILK